MTPNTSTETEGVLSERITALKESVDRLHKELNDTYVRQDVFDARMQGHDRELMDLKQSDKELKEDIKSSVKDVKDLLEKLENSITARRVPWTAIGAFVLAAVSVFVSVLPKLVA